jgi:hypothetical protein
VDLACIAPAIAAELRELGYDVIAVADRADLRAKARCRHPGTPDRLL